MPESRGPYRVLVRRGGTGVLVHPAGVSRRTPQPGGRPTDARSIERWRTRYCGSCDHGFYNRVRPHWALRPVAGGDVLTPHEVYTGQLEVELPRWQGWARAARRKLQELLDAEQASLEVGAAA